MPSPTLPQPADWPQRAFLCAVDSIVRKSAFLKMCYYFFANTRDAWYLKKNPEIQNEIKKKKNKKQKNPFDWSKIFAYYNLIFVHVEFLLNVSVVVVRYTKEKNLSFFWKKLKPEINPLVVPLRVWFAFCESRVLRLAWPHGSGGLVPGGNVFLDQLSGGLSILSVVVSADYLSSVNLEAVCASWPRSSSELYFYSGAYCGSAR